MPPLFKTCGGEADVGALDSHPPCLTLNSVPSLTLKTLRYRFRYRGQTPSFNQCFLCKTLCICLYEVNSRGNWQPVCRHCAKQIREKGVQL